MRRNLLVIFALLLGVTTIQAKPVDVNTAQRLGRNFIQHKAMFSKSATNSLDLAYTYRTESGLVTAYVFNFDGGFVIVAADDCSSPILGYSDRGHFDYETAPDGLRFMLSEISNGIETMVRQGNTVPNDILCRWKNLEAYGVMHPDRNFPVVGPLVQLKWNQDFPYNMYAPGGCPTGCVATAMAQLMKYWDWPVTGTGEHSYYAVGYGEQYANFGATTYDWDNMIEVYTSSATQEQKEAVATLMYHCGISVDMMYEPDGSGAFSVDVPVAINTYFSYSDHATHITKSNYSYNDWIALLKSNIDQHIPLYYSGQSTEGGHAFVCDGYDNDDLFYFNWGWGGSSNGFFLIDGEHFDYSGSQAIVYDFIPNYVYDAMPKAPENLSVSIDNDVSRIGHLTWTNPSETMTGETLTSIDKIIVKRNSIVVKEITDVEPGATMTYDDEVPFFDQFEYTILAVRDDNYGRTALTNAVFGPYCDWKVVMTSSNFQGWDGGGITVQNAAGSYIDFLTTTTSSAQIQTFQMALGNNNLYWVEPNSVISNISFKVRDAENQIVYQYEGPSSGLEAGLLRTLNNSCGNENTCEAPYNLKATLDPENDQTVILTWDSDHEPEFGYCIYRDGILFNMAHETRYVDEHTNIGGHCYYVTALCNGGETVNSNEYCITSGTGCDAPTDLYYYYASNKVQLVWSAPENIEPTGYVIYRKTEETNYKEIKRLRQTTYKDSSAQQGVVYQYAVVSYYQDIDCFSSYANDLLDEGKYYIKVDWSNMPQDLQAELVENEEGDHVNLRWKPAFQASSYDIMRNGVKIGEVNEVMFEDEELEYGETYCYQITAHGDGFETASNEACLTMPNAPEPPVLPCSAPTGLRRGTAWPSIEWTAPEDRTPDNYVVVVIDHLLNDATTEISGVTETTYVDEVSTEEVAFDRSYKVKAIYPECESEFALADNGEDFIRISNVSVGENQLSNVKLYPNPTSGQLNIEAEEMTSISVYDLVGQCLMQMSVKDGQATLDMSQLQNGIYLIKVSTANGSVMQRVVRM